MQKMTAAQFIARKPKSKYGACRAKRKELTFHSKREAAYYDKLVNDQKNGVIAFFLMQVPFRLPGNKKYLVDFMTFTIPKGQEAGWADVEYIDVKGFMTPMSQLKIDQVEELYKIKIKIVK